MWMGGEPELLGFLSLEDNGEHSPDHAKDSSGLQCYADRFPAMSLSIVILLSPSRPIILYLEAEM
jgi:hypothetical protein